MDRKAMLVAMFLPHGILMGMYGLGERREAYMKGVAIGIPYAFDTKRPAQIYAANIGNGSMTYEKFLEYKAHSIAQAQFVYNLLPNDPEALRFKHHPDSVAGWWQRVHAKLLRYHYLINGTFLDTPGESHEKPRFLMSELNNYQRFRIKTSKEGQVELDVSKSNLAAVDAHLLNMPRAQEITRLNISDNDLSFHEINIDILRWLPKLKYLNLRNNKLDKRTVDYIASFLPGVEVDG